MSKGEMLAALIRQSRQEARALAAMLHAHMDEYMAEGFSREEAIALCVAFLNGTAGRVD